MKIYQKNILRIMPILFILIIVACCIAKFYRHPAKPLEYKSRTTEPHTSEKFTFETIKSETDFNHNGIDDYTDIMLGARKDAENKPRYDGSFYAVGGYPPDDIGVCTDVLWRGFKNAGYSLKDMVDKDISDHISLYSRVNRRPDRNIDFRRVKNLMVFFERYALSLTTDTQDYAEWQPGDIVFYGDIHCGIVSDKRNEDGRPLLIHNVGQPLREEDSLDWGEVSAHYRFVAQDIPNEYLIAFKNNQVSAD